MAICNEIMVSKTHESLRIDGEYYLPNYIENEAVLSKLETKPLPVLFFVSDGNHMGISQYFTNEPTGIPYYRGQDINDFFLENTMPIHIPQNIYEKPFIRRSHFKEDDILLSIVGTVGNLAIVTEYDVPATGSCKIAIIRPKGKMNPYYLAAFLLSSYGQLQVKRNTRGAVQTGLILEDMHRIRIPVIAPKMEEEIESLIKSSIKENRQAKSLYSEAKQLLESELGLDKIAFEKPIGYEASYSEIFDSSRYDADYFQPKYRMLDNIVSKFEVKRIREVSEKLETGSYSPKYSEEGIPYIRGVDINTNGYIDIEHLLKTTGLNRTSQNTVKTNDILVTRVGSIGVCGLVENNLNKSFFSDNLIRIRIREDLKNSIFPQFLNILFNSTYGQMQMIRYSRGSVQQRLNQTQLGLIPIPIVSREIQLQIEEIMISYRRSESQSKIFLDQAKRRVEDLIEEATNHEPVS
jgi:restriction endonuclease S subunit